ncbi:MAG: hypothetical protein AAFN65_09985, partial [Bacteroidota bacterium]
LSICWLEIHTIESGFMKSQFVLQQNGDQSSGFGYHLQTFLSRHSREHDLVVGHQVNVFSLLLETNHALALTPHQSPLE